jgi:hypothetical protein
VGSLGIGFCPIISGRLLNGWKILSSAQKFALWKNPDAGKKKKTIGQFWKFYFSQHFWVDDKG